MCGIADVEAPRHPQLLRKRIDQFNRFGILAYRLAGFQQPHLSSRQSFPRTRHIGEWMLRKRASRSHGEYIAPSFRSIGRSPELAVKRAQFHDTGPLSVNLHGALHKPCQPRRIVADVNQFFHERGLHPFIGHGEEFQQLECSHRLFQVGWGYFALRFVARHKAVSSPRIVPLPDLRALAR